MKTRNLLSGVNPCVAWDGDTIRCAYQSDPKRTWSLVESTFTADLEPIVPPVAYPLQPEASATPCYVLSEDGDRLLAFKDGAPDYPLIILRHDEDFFTLDTRVQGMLASRGTQLAWQVATGPASWQVRSNAADFRDVRPSDDAEGIAHIRADGWPLLRREWRTYSPLGTMPAEIDIGVGELSSARAKILLVESEDGGLIGRWGNLPGWLSVFPGEATSDPRAALSADGQRLAVCGWGPAPGGIWLASLTREDLGLPHVAQIGRPCFVGSFKTYGFEAT